MKKVELKISFNITEKEYSKKEFQDLKNHVLNGEMKKDLQRDNLFKTQDMKITIETK